MDTDTITAGCGCWSCQVFVPKAIDSLSYLSDESRRLRFNLRKAEVTPPASLESAFYILQRTADEALGRTTL